MKDMFAFFFLFRLINSRNRELGQFVAPRHLIVRQLELNLKELALLITKLDTMLSTIDFFDYRKINELMC